MEEADILFDLVKRLSDLELQFIRKFAHCGHRPPEKALLLLEQLRKMPRYDKRLLEGKDSNYTATRFQLRQIILRALRAKRDGETVDSQILSQIEDYRIFYEKGFLDEAIRSLNKAHEWATAHQNQARLLEIINLQKHRILENETSNLPGAIAERNRALDKIVTAYAQEMEMVSTYHSAFANYRTKEREELNSAQFYPDELLDSPATPFNTRLYGLMIGSIEARRIADLQLAKKYVERTVALWEAFPEITKDRAATYKIILANYALYLIPDNEYDKVREILGKIEKLKDKNFNEEAETFQNVANLRLLLQLNEFPDQKPDALVTYIKDGLTKYAAKINAARQFSLWYNMMLLHFVHQQYREARNWIDEIIKHRSYDIRKEIQYITRVIELVIFYELEIWDTPESNVMAVYRYLSRKDELTPFKREVLALFTKLSATPINQRQGEFQKLYDKLIDNQDTENASDGLGLRLVTAWVGSKLRNKTILQALKDF
jgi:hypothetical protein